MTYPLFFFLFWSPSPCFSSFYFTLSHLFFRCISIPLSLPLLFPDYIYTYICHFISIGLITSFSLPSPFLPHFVSSPPPLSIFLFLSLSIPSPSYPFSPTLSFFSLSLPLIHPFLPPLSFPASLSPFPISVYVPQLFPASIILPFRLALSACLSLLCRLPSPRTSSPPHPTPNGSPRTYYSITKQFPPTIVYL